MGANIPISGNISYGSGAIYAGSEVKYQVYFNKVNASSSDSIWGSIKFSVFGQYNFSLADSDLLTDLGNASSGDTVVIVFWTGSSSTRNGSCLEMVEWSATEITLTSDTSYWVDTQTKTNIVPNLSWTLIDDGLVNTPYTATNNSNDVHDWVWSSTSMHHWYDRYSQIINVVNYINNTDYDWDDGNQDNNLSGAASRSHSWDTAGSYDVEIVIEDECAATVTGTENIIIKWNPPLPDIMMIPSNPDPNVPVSFQWDGVDEDGRITNIDWEIIDSGAYGNTDTTTSGLIGDVIPHSAGTGTDWCGQLVGNSGAFTNPGSHTVKIIYHWFDGFDWHHDPDSKIFTQDRFSGPTVSFTQVPSEAVMDSEVKFVNTSTDTSRVGLGSDCDEYDWTFTDDGTATDYLDKPKAYDLEVTPGSVDCQTRLCANWSDGFDTQTTCVPYNVPFKTTVVVTDEDCYHHLKVYGTSGDGTVTGYSWTVSSGISEIGPWSEVWSSPVGMDQQEKDVNFCSVSWYMVEGSVYGGGATTTDNEVLYISEVCASGTGDVVAVAICEPDMFSDEQGQISMYGQELKPSMKANSPGIPRGEIILRPFPRPGHLN